MDTEKKTLVDRIDFYIGRIKSGRIREMWAQTKWIYGYAKKYWPAMIFYTILGLGGTVMGLLSSLISKDLIDIITGHQTGEVVKYFSLTIGIAVANIFINQITNYASTWISLKVNQEIRAEFFEKIMVTDWESLTNYHTGDLLTRWSSDASSISDGVLSYIPNLIINIFRFFSAFAIVIYYDWTFAIFAMIGIPFSLLMSKTLLTRMQNNNQRSAAMNARMSGFNQEAFSNIQTIKAFDLIRLYSERLKQLQKEYIDMRLEFNRMSIVTSIILGFVGLLVSYSSYGWGIYRVWSGVISYGTMTMFLSLSGTLTGAVNSLASLVPGAISLTTSAGRPMAITEMPQEDYSRFTEANTFMEENKASGVSLNIDDIAYSYHTGTEVFSHASFEAHPHEIIGLVGPSGEGKTTMLRLLLSLLPFMEGTGFISGADGIEDISKAKVYTDYIPLSPSTRQFFSYVPQGNTMFSGTIAENMRSVKPDATDAEIWEALTLACADDFVKKLPDQLDSKIKERGGGFSEGQAQRLSIARALLRKSPILLLDEASSALDVATERKVLKNIMADTYPRVCIVTTHRPTVLTLCKRVYEIKDKKLDVLSEEEVNKLIADF